MIVVSNTTPLIGLASIGQFGLLEQLFGVIYIPEAVFDEVVVAGRDFGGAKREVSTAVWIKTIPINNRLAVDVLLDDLDLGEAEAIVLAQELDADWVLMDEKKARRKLNQLKMPKIGTLGILLKAKQIGLITTIRPELEILRENGFSISQPVIDTILQAANEI